MPPLSPLMSLYGLHIDRSKFQPLNFSQDAISCFSAISLALIVAIEQLSLPMGDWASMNFDIDRYLTKYKYRLRTS